MAIILLTITVRVVGSCIYSMEFTPDTESFMTTAKAFSSGNYHEYTGKRPPVYPYLIQLLNFDMHKLMLLQLTAGVIISILIFYIFRELKAGLFVSVLAALSYGLNACQLFFEFKVMSETISTLTLMSGIFFLFRISNKSSNSNLIYICLSGIMFALTILNRAMFQPLILLVPLYLIIRKRSGCVIGWSRIIIMILILLCPMLGWMNFQRTKQANS